MGGPSISKESHRKQVLNGTMQVAIKDDAHTNEERMADDEERR
jgi:hypothetical protein